MTHLKLAASIALFAGLFVACAQDPATKRQRFFESGSKYSREGRHKEAAIEYRNAIQIDPKFAKARVQLAETYVKLGDAAGALNEYVRAADLLPDDVVVQVIAGRYLLASGRVDEALARADAVLARQPNHVEAHILRGSALGGLNNFDQALSAIEEAIRIDPARGDSHLQLGLIELARGKREAAESALLKAVSLDPKWIGGHLALANFYLAVGDADKARSELSAALTLDPKNEAANRAMAVFSLVTRRPAEAEKYFKQVVDSTGSVEAVFSLADYYIGTGRPQQAIDQLKSIAESPRSTPEVRNRLASAFAAAGDHRKATALVDEILKENPRHSSAKLLKGQLFLHEGRADDALAAVQSAVAIEPASAVAQFALGRLYASRGDTQGAEQAFREVLNINPRAVAAQVELSRLHLLTNNAAGSLSLAEAAVSSEPGNVQARIALVRSLLATKSYGRAERELKALLTERPTVPEVHVLNGILAVSRNDAARARADFTRAIELDENSVEALSGLVGLDLGAKDPARAVQRIEARLSNGTPDGDLLLLAARVYAAAHTLDKAEHVLRRAIEVQPSLLPAYGMLGQLYVQQRRLEDARTEFEALVQRQSKPVGALTMAGIILQAEGKSSLARQRFEQALALDPRAPVAANNLAWLYLEAKENLNQAVQLAETAAAALPESPEVLHTLGWAYYQNNVPTLAVTQFAKCVEKQPKRALYHYHLGLAYAKAGDISNARQSLSRAQSVAPRSPEALDAQRALEQLDSQ